MDKLKKKIVRYRNLIKKVINWKLYLWYKIIGFKDSFDFNLVDFGHIIVSKNMLSPFKETFLDGIYFRHIPKELLYNKTNLTIIDVGANAGFFSLSAFSKFPKAKIYAFEPHPFCYNVLKSYQQNFSKYSWKIYKQALSDKKGEIYLNASTIDGFTTMASILNTGEGQKFLVETNSLNTFIFENDFDKIDFIKLDCEGAEYSILYSISESIFEKINSLCIETHKGKGINQNIYSLNEFLNKKGYITKLLDHGGYTGYIWAWKNINYRKFD